MRALMISTSDLRFFAVVADSPSLAAAARGLDVSPPAVTQRLAQLEQRLGARLLNRTGRQMTLTDEGEILARRAAAIVSDLQELDEVFAERRHEVVGKLRILAPFGFGRQHVAPIVSSFMLEYPHVSAELTLKASLTRQSDDSWDMIVHIGHLPNSRLAVQKIAPNRRIACAAPAYIDRAGPIAHPLDLQRHSCLALRENDEDVTLWRFLAQDKTAIPVRIDPVLSTNDGDVLCSWARAGHGVIVRSEWSIAEDIAEGRLSPILEDFDLPEADVVVLLGPRAQRSTRTRLFLQHLRQALTPAPWRLTQH